MLSNVISKSYEELKTEVEDRSWWKKACHPRQKTEEILLLYLVSIYVQYVVVSKSIVNT